MGPIQEAGIKRMLEAYYAPHRDMDFICGAIITGTNFVDRFNECHDWYMMWGMRIEYATERARGYLGDTRTWMHDHADSVYAPSRWFGYDPISGTHDRYNSIRHYDAAIWSALKSRNSEKLRDTILNG